MAQGGFECGAEEGMGSPLSPRQLWESWEWSREVRKLGPEKPRGRGLGLEGRDLARAV